MGGRYIRFRIWHEYMRRSGSLKNRFPADVPQINWCSLSDWKITRGKFFFSSREELHFTRQPSPDLEKRFLDYKEGRLLFFNSIPFSLGANYDWVTNPDNGFKYDAARHWTEIPDYSKEAGDIKFVWEKSRFSFLMDIIRYDYHFEKDCAKEVLDEIESWIDGNPVNCGPNYRCSQEISLRVLNWVFALYYYSNNELLTNDLFAKIQHHIYWQLHHVYHNIDFSRIAVRNNHAITETLTLYLAGIFFPGQKEIAKWSEEGKKWFEEEIGYQIYDDGTFLQFSMNYHRVVVQLLSWGIRLSERNHVQLAPIVYERAKASLRFLRVCMDDVTGWLPNYGANDGALFFRYNNAHYRDYRPQLQAFAGVLGIDAHIDAEAEDTCWLGGNNPVNDHIDASSAIYSFDKGGYYLFREKECLTFIRCGNHKDRPSQADNLHLDIWYKGENILQDAGSYKYNTDPDLLKYFMGTRSHNTVMLGDQDQMQKGGRFIWYHWTQAVAAEIIEDDATLLFTGTISAFRHLGKDIRHTRTVCKKRDKAEWIVKDIIEHMPANHLPMHQLWHLPLTTEIKIDIAAADKDKQLLPSRQASWYSGLYGQKEEEQEIVFTTAYTAIDTIISIKEP